MNIGVTLAGANALSQQLGDAGTVIGTSTINTMRRVGIKLQNSMQRDQLSGQALNTRTGAGRRSVFYRVVVDQQSQEFGVVIGVDLTIAPYMRIQEFGGVIVPRHAKYLTVPLPAALTGKGVARFSAQTVIGNPQSCGYVDTFFAKNVLFGVLGHGKSATIVPLFALKSSITIRPVGYMRHTLDANVEWIMQQFDVDLGAAVKILGTSPSGEQ